MKKLVVIIALALTGAACTPAQIREAIRIDKARPFYTWACKNDQGTPYGFYGHPGNEPAGCVRVSPDWVPQPDNGGN